MIGAIVGGFITGGGIGGAILVSRQQNRVDKVFAGLLASLLGIVLFIAINVISGFALRHWHVSVGGGLRVVLVFVFANRPTGTPARSPNVLQLRFERFRTERSDWIIQ